MQITNMGFQDLLSHGSMIYHELLILSLEVICAQFNSNYLDPSFSPLLQQHSWDYISRCFAPAGQQTMGHPSLSCPSICIPIHINGNHWI